jgi:hypothetical protein
MKPTPAVSPDSIGKALAQAAAAMVVPAGNASAAQVGFVPEHPVLHQNSAVLEPKTNMFTSLSGEGLTVIVTEIC